MHPTTYYRGNLGATQVIEYARADFNAAIRLNIAQGGPDIYDNQGRLDQLYRILGQAWIPEAELETARRTTDELMRIVQGHSTAADAADYDSKFAVNLRDTVMELGELQGFLKRIGERPPVSKAEAIVQDLFDEVETRAAVERLLLGR
jgi:hypothetical protein